MPTSTTARRAAVGLVATAVAATGLAGCAAPDDGSLTMTIWGGEADLAVYQERLDLAAEAYPEIDVELVQISDAYDTKLQTMFAGGTAPDILMIAEGVNALSSRGQLTDLAPLLDEAGVDSAERWSQGLVDTYSTDGSLWAAPDRAGAMVMYYNQDLFDAAGVAYPDGSWTWEEFRAAAEQLTVADGDAASQWGYAAGDWWPWYLTWMEQNGGGILDDDGAPIANSPENVEALEFYNSMVFDDRSAPSPLDYANAGLENGQPDALFSQGALAMETTGFWGVATFADAEFDWGIAPLWQGAEQAVPAFGSALAVSSQSDHSEEAAQIVEFLTSAEGQLPLAESGLDVPANQEVASSDAFLQADWNTADVDLSAFANPEGVFAPPIVPEWNEIQTAFTNGMAATYNGEATVEEGLDLVQADLERILG